MGSWATGSGGNIVRSSTSEPSATRMVSGAAPTNQPTQLKCARLVSGRRPHASKHVPEPLRKANISGPAPTHAPRPSKADERPRSGRRNASATASASGEVSDTRPVLDGTSGVMSSPVTSSIAVCHSTPGGNRRTSSRPMRKSSPDRAVAAARP